MSSSTLLTLGTYFQSSSPFYRAVSFMIAEEVPLVILIF
jgi:hypothetical protein